MLLLCFVLLYLWILLWSVLPLSILSSRSIFPLQPRASLKGQEHHAHSQTHTLQFRFYWRLSERSERGFPSCPMKQRFIKVDCILPFPPLQAKQLMLFFLIIPSLPCIFSNICFVTLSKFIVTLNLHKLCTGEKPIVSKAYALGCLFSDLRLLINVFILWKFIFFGGESVNGNRGLSY